MTRFAAFLRAVNVGGTGKLPMSELTEMCRDAGFGEVRTYIASGNVVFTSDLGESDVKQALESRLAAYAGKPVPVFVRTAEELAAILRDNPFAERDGKVTVAFLLDTPPPEDAEAGARGRAREEIAIGRREIYVHYPDGQGRSKLKLAAAETGTARNMNTIAKVLEMASGG